MSERVLPGMLTPSSNTALEPLTSAIVAGLPEVSAHFGRFRVRRIALSDDALAQFEIGPMLAAQLATAGFAPPPPALLSRAPWTPRAATGQRPPCRGP